MTLITIVHAGSFEFGQQKAVQFAFGCVLMTVLVRQPTVLRLVYFFLLNIFRYWWVPLPVKHAVVSFVWHIGGVHSGFAASAIIWLAYALALICSHSNAMALWGVAIAAAVLLLALVSVFATSLPQPRARYHNLFESVHRFVGWLCLALVWTIVIIYDGFDADQAVFAFHILSFVTAFEFWVACIVTFFIALPWSAYVHKVPVATVVQSTSIVTLKFHGGLRLGLLGAVARHPLKDWHSFGSISDGPDSDWHMLVVIALGDFTKELINDPPTHLFTRRLKAVGGPYMIPMYHRVLIVATGTGIGVFLSAILQHPEMEIFFVWIGRDLRKTFGDEIYEIVEKCPSDRLTILDVAEVGKPDVPQLTVGKSQEVKAEVVFMSSNSATVQATLALCHSEGTACFGPIWDS